MINIRLLACLCACQFIGMPQAYAGQAEEIRALKAQVQMLMQKIEALEQRQQQQEEAAREKQADAVPPSAMPAAPSQMAENTGNPSVSVIATITGDAVRGGLTPAGTKLRRNSFLPLSEAEFVFGAEVDAHARLDVTVTAANGGMAVEEGYLTARLPEGFNLRAGRKFIPLGRANETHPHALVYADTPNGLVNLFGAEKFTGDGLLLDRPWYVGDSSQHVLLGVFQTGNDVAFDPTGNSRSALMGRWIGLWDVDDLTTLELGSSYINGGNGRGRTQIVGGHAVVKRLNFDRSGWSLEGEWNRALASHGLLPKTRTDGAYALAEYDLDRQWRGFGRFDYSRTIGLAAEQAYSAGIGWKLSEFQHITLQYKHTAHALPQMASWLGLQPGQHADELLFRWVAAIGPHGAHRY